MAKIAADEKVLNVNSDFLRSFMSDLRNFRDIMPEQVENWQAGRNSCTFSISSLGNLGMQKGEFSMPNCFGFISNEQSKVQFELDFYFDDIAEGQMTGYFEIRTDMNPMIEMMAKRPLTNFVNILTENLKQKTG